MQTLWRLIKFTDHRDTPSSDNGVSFVHVSLSHRQHTNRLDDFSELNILSQNHHRQISRESVVILRVVVILHDKLLRYDSHTASLIRVIDIVSAQNDDNIFLVLAIFAFWYDAMSSGDDAILGNERTTAEICGRFLMLPFEERSEPERESYKNQSSINIPSLVCCVGIMGKFYVCHNQVLLTMEIRHVLVQFLWKLSQWLQLLRGYRKHARVDRRLAVQMLIISK